MTNLAPNEGENINATKETKQVPDTDLLTRSVREEFGNVIKYKSLIWDVFNFENGCFTVRKADESKILSNHFKGIPIVPGIIMKLLLLSIMKRNGINKVNDKYIKTTTHKTGMPGSKIFLGEDGKSLVDEEGKAYISVEFVDNLNNAEPRVYREGFRQIEKEKISSKTKLPEVELEKYLLQAGEFRFAHNSASIHKADEKIPNEGDMFQGKYQISPEDIYFLDSNGNTNEIFHGFFEEIAAQIASLAMGEVNGELIGKDAKIITLKESVFKFEHAKLKNRLKNNSTIYITGLIVKIHKRHVSFIFIGKNEKGENLFRGELSGSTILAKSLTKMVAKGEKSE